MKILKLNSWENETHSGPDNPTGSGATGTGPSTNAGDASVDTGMGHDAGGGRRDYGNGGDSDKTRTNTRGGLKNQRNLDDEKEEKIAANSVGSKAGGNGSLDETVPFNDDMTAGPGANSMTASMDLDRKVAAGEMTQAQADAAEREIGFSTGHRDTDLGASSTTDPKGNGSTSDKKEPLRGEKDPLVKVPVGEGETEVASTVGFGSTAGAEPHDGDAPDAGGNFLSKMGGAIMDAGRAAVGAVAGAGRAVVDGVKSAAGAVVNAGSRAWNGLFGKDKDDQAALADKEAAGGAPEEKSIFQKGLDLANRGLAALGRGLDAVTGALDKGQEYISNIEFAPLKGALTLAYAPATGFNLMLTGAKGIVNMAGSATNGMVNEDKTFKESVTGVATDAATNAVSGIAKDLRRGVSQLINAGKQINQDVVNVNNSFRKASVGEKPADEAANEAKNKQTVEATNSPTGIGTEFNANTVDQPLPGTAPKPEDTPEVTTKKLGVQGEAPQPDAPPQASGM